MAEPTMKDLVQSTLAVLFVGCPHRDAQHGRLSDAVVSMAGAVLRSDPSDPVLQDLSGANSAMLNLGRQAFVRLWNDYNFRVRTYQENVPLGSTLRDQKPEHVKQNQPFTALVRRLMSEIRYCGVKQPPSATPENKQRPWTPIIWTRAGSNPPTMRAIGRCRTISPALLAKNTPE